MKVGDEVYVVPTRNKHTQSKYYKVSKIGNKYFELDGLYQDRFYKDTLQHDGGQYTSLYQVYLSKSHHEKELEIQNKITKIRTQLGQYGYCSIDRTKIELIYNILFENK